MRISDWSSDVCSSDLTDRRPQVVAEADVGGGKAEGAAAAVALLDPPLDLPGAAEQLGGLGRTPLAQMGADDGGGVDLAVAGHHGVDGGDAEAVLSPHRLQQPGVAGPLVAEAERPADPHDIGSASCREKVSTYV